MLRAIVYPICLKVFVNVGLTGYELTVNLTVLKNVHGLSYANDIFFGMFNYPPYPSSYSNFPFAHILCIYVFIYVDVAV